MLFAISGSQGSGKTTVINSIRDLGYNVIERKTSRSILSEWGVSLSEVNNNQEMTIKFQHEITNRKWEDEKAAIVSPDVWFTERTHLDLFAYALVAIGKDNEYSDWIDQYFKTCVSYSQQYQHTFFLPTGCFDVEADNVRGNNKHYSNMVNDLLYELTITNLKNQTTITPCDIEYRVRDVLTLTTYGKQ